MVDRGDEHLERAVLGGRFRHVLDDRVEERVEVRAVVGELVLGDAGLAVRVDHREVGLLVARAELDEEVEHLVDHLHRACVAAVDLVDHADGAQVELERLAQDEPRLRHDAFRRVDEQDDTLHHLEDPLDLAAEVGVSGGVDDVEFDPGVFDRRVFCKDRNASFPLERVRVHRAGLGVLAFAIDAALAEHGVHQRRLAVVDVSDDRDVADVGPRPGLAHKGLWYHTARCDVTTRIGSSDRKEDKHTHGGAPQLQPRLETLMSPFTRARSFGRLAAVVGAVAVLSACGGRSIALPPAGGSQSGGTAGAARHVRSIGGASYQDVCAPPGAGRASCLAVIPMSRTPMHQPASTSASARRTSAVEPGDDFPYYGWWPSDLAAAYNLPANKHAGSGTTVAIVDAYDAPGVESDLAVYRSFFGLPACTTANGCFKKVNGRGRAGNYPPNGQPYGWTLEVALDVDAVSAVCPNCHIVLVESDSDYVNDLAVAAATAGRMADVVSNSYYAPEVDPQPSPGEQPTTAYASSYVHSGVVYVAGTGDYGYEAEGLFGVQADGDSPFPAGITSVVAVGGTVLNNPDYPNPKTYSETAWSGSGGGCSTLYPKPIWQILIACPHRMSADAAATADGLSVYDSADMGGWGDVGGTSASTPIVASVFALAKDNGGTLGAASLYVYGNALNDITTGSSGTCAPEPSYFCNARPGYDGPTGMGSPNGTRAFKDIF